MANGREVYLISDLHLGGVQPTSSDPNDRGFRICTHGQELARFVEALAAKPPSVELIVNGDMVDFLAEDDGGAGWLAFTGNQAEAVRKLDAIIDRDRSLFEAFAGFLARGHRLVLLLGNHDVELSLPAVRQRLAERLGITGRQDFLFLYDGEAYRIGRVLIEHGNRYDQFNVVDYDSLRRVRSLLSRNQEIPGHYAFAAPAGSHIVAEVMNPIKAHYRIIDLLKPENDAMIPILMAIEPGYRKVLTRIAALGLQARRHRVKEPAMPSFAGDISAQSSGAPFEEHSFASDISSGVGRRLDALETILHNRLGRHHAAPILSAAPQDHGFAEDISARQTIDAARETIDRACGIVRLLLANDHTALQSRLPPLLAAIRSVQGEAFLARDTECYTEYLDAARDLAEGGFDYVIFGHTHAARDVRLQGGARYLNLGTWADLICFPSHILAGPDAAALDGLRAFVEDMAAGRLSGWTTFTPTYVKMVIGGDGAVVDAALCDYRSADQI
jgi:UDP-2,3-diacylglucosamine pyrophosphatase LpxH